MTGKKILFYLMLGIISLSFLKCTQQVKSKGKLYIIGGGKRPDAMVQQIINLANLRKKGYLVVLPMASEEPDSAAYYATKQFTDRGICNSLSIIFQKGDTIKQWWIDTLKNASLIYISGGDQKKFMDIVGGTPIHEAIVHAFQNGAVIAGTSAGAAVMSKLMITGRKLKFPDDERYGQIVAKNIEVTEGLGLVKRIIIDQHFVKRERLNRLISVSIENPDYLCAGIDESTALLVSGDSATVCGIGQVVLLDASKAEIISKDSLLGAKNLKIDVLTPGQRFKLP